MPLPSIRLIAKQVGLSKSAVSLGLRNDSSIPVATRERIHAAAKAMGYRLNPLVAALMTQQRSGHAAERAPLIIFIDYYGASQNPHPGNKASRLGKEATEQLARAAVLVKEAALRYGYQVDYLKARDAGMTPERLEQIVRSRGTRGVIVLMPAGVNSVWANDWPECCVVEMSGQAPRFHQVRADQVMNTRLLLKELKRMGYRRPGLAMAASNDEPGHFVRMAWLDHFEGASDANRGPLLLAADWTEQDFLRWYRREKPDVVASMDLAPLRWLKEAGVRVPEEVGFACLDLLPQHRSTSAGIDGRQDVKMQAAVGVLDVLLRHNECGPALEPVSTTVCGRWVNGPSVRQMVS